MALRSEGFDARALDVADVQKSFRRKAPHQTGLIDLDLGRDAGGQYVNGADLVDGLGALGWKVLIVSGSVDRPGVAAAIASGSAPRSPSSSESR